MVVCGSDYDHVTIYDDFSSDEDTIIGTYCGTTIPEYFQSSGQSMRVVFKSDEYLNFKGFSVDYKFVPGKYQNTTHYRNT